MAPMKFEENIKEKLDGRTIKPSAKSWDAIESGLKTAKKEQKSVNYGRILAAACFIGIIGAGVLFLLKEDNAIDTPVLVETPIEAESIENDKTELVEESKSKEQVVEVKKEEINKPVDSRQLPVTPEKIAFKEQKPVKTEQKSEIAENSNSPKEEVINEVQPAINTKVNELLQKYNALEEQNTAVTDAEIDALLKQAEEEIYKERIYDEQTRKVDANALLMDVEQELDRSFRDKVFEALKDGFYKAREAVADRNN
ncbi:hypothetical protein ACH3O9_03435 [Leeuwenhoekiella sp. A16]|uniref:hypothetical protein n=1 Tax=unclassified Leeuwenhoekiella TaxID=2615029 RepID=UPI003A7F9909